MKYIVIATECRYGNQVKIETDAPDKYDAEYQIKLYFPHLSELNVMTPEEFKEYKQRLGIKE